MAGRFIVLSDIHLNLWSYGDPEDRLTDQVEAIECVLQRAVDESVDAVLWTGDIFHTQGMVHTHVLHKLYKALYPFQDLAKKTVFLPGNHDMVYRNRSDLHALDFLSAFGHVPVAQCGYWAPISITNMPLIWPFPYTDQPNFLQNWLNLFENRDHDLLLMHQGVAGVDFQSKGFVLDEGLSASMVPGSVLHAFVGHCHSLRRVTENITVPGALQQHNFGDAGDNRGYLMVDYSEDGIVMHQHAVGNTRFISIPYSEDLEFLDDLVAKEDYYADNEFMRITDVPVSRIDEVRAVTRYSTGNDIKIMTRAEVHVPLKVQQSEIGDIESLLQRFGKENDLEPGLLEVGREILKGVPSGVS